MRMALRLPTARAELATETQGRHSGRFRSSDAAEIHTSQVWVWCASRMATFRGQRMTAKREGQTQILSDKELERIIDAFLEQQRVANAKVLRVARTIMRERWRREATERDCARRPAR